MTNSVATATGESSSKGDIPVLALIATVKMKMTIHTQTYVSAAVCYKTEH